MSDLPGKSNAHPPGGPFARKAIIAVGVASSAIVLLLLLWYSVHVLLLAFAGVLLGIMLNGLSAWVSRRTRMRYGWSLTFVVAMIVVALFVFASFAGAGIVSQVEKLSETLPVAIERLSAKLAEYQWAREVFDLPTPDGAAAPDSGTAATQPATTQPTTDATAPPGGSGNSGQRTSVVEQVMTATEPLSRAARFVGRILNVAVAAIVVSIVGIYVAATPTVYVNGFLRLIPLPKRPRAREVLDAIGYTLRWWLVGQGITMAFIGVLTAIGLKIIGIELWLLLGILTALVNFIPNIGPVIAFVPAALLASTSGLRDVAWVALLFLFAQNLEGYVLTPLVQRKAIHFPPALLIVAQILMGVLAGGLGVILAAPLSAAVLVAVRMLYVEDMLGDEIDTPDDRKKTPDDPKKAPSDRMNAPDAQRDEKT